MLNQEIINFANYLADIATEISKKYYIARMIIFFVLHKAVLDAHLINSHYRCDDFFGD